MWETYRKRRMVNATKLPLVYWVDELTKVAPYLPRETAFDMMREMRRRGRELFYRTPEWEYPR